MTASRKNATARDVAERIYADLVEGRPAGPFRHTERALLAHYEVHRTTLISALNLLVRQGKLERVENESATRGRYAIPDTRKRITVVTTPSPSPFHLPAAIAEDDERTWSAPVVVSEIPDEHIRVLFPLRRNQHTTVHRQDRLVDGVPTGLAETYFAPVIAKLTGLTAAASEAEIQATIERAGHHIARGTDRTSEEMPTAQQREDWSIPEGKNLIRTLRVAWDNDGVVVYVRITSLNGAVHDVEHGMPREAFVHQPRHSID